MALPTVSIFGTINKKELKYLPSGKAICTYKIECSEKNAKGEWDNLYIDGISFDKQAEFVNNHFNDGDLCIATGKLITEVYENKEGKKVYTIKLKFPNIEFAPKSKNSAPQQKQSAPNKPQPKQEEFPEIDIDSETIPF